MTTSSKKRFNLVCRLFSIRSRQWMRRRSLTPRELDLCAELQERLREPPYTREEFELFSRVVREGGGVVFNPVYQ
jgi:hypothetical protein